MPTVKFTDRFVRNVKSAETRLDYRDEAFNGGDFGLRVTPAGRKTFFLRYVVSNKHRRLKLGTYPSLSLGEARRKALALLNQTNDGVD